MRAAISSQPTVVNSAPRIRKAGGRERHSVSLSTIPSNHLKFSLRWALGCGRAVPGAVMATRLCSDWSRKGSLGGIRAMWCNSIQSGGSLLPPAPPRSQNPLCEPPPAPQPRAALLPQRLPPSVPHTDPSLQTAGSRLVGVHCTRTYRPSSKMQAYAWGGAVCSQGRWQTLGGFSEGQEPDPRGSREHQPWFHSGRPL